MITIEQCRAARGLIGWTQQDLADASGLSKTAINNFEKEHSDIKAESLNAIRLAFESLDIEFIAQDGVKKKSESALFLKETYAFESLLTDIITTLESSNDKTLRIIDLNALYIHEIKNIAPDTLINKLNKAAQSIKIITLKGSPKDFKSEDTKIKGMHIIHLNLEDIDKNIVIPTTFIYGQKVAYRMWNKSGYVILNASAFKKAELQRFNTLINHIKNI